jgi:hypothetical protein
MDIWLQNRPVVLASVKQHLDRAKLNMKAQADKKHIARQFVVGDQVFFKLQPYVQASVADRANHKLTFKYCGPTRCWLMWGKFPIAWIFQKLLKSI